MTVLVLTGQVATIQDAFGHQTLHVTTLGALALWWSSLLVIHALGVNDEMW